MSSSPHNRTLPKVSNPNEADVIVIGGGFSGVQAAYDLHVAGHSVILVEARPRLGGRSLSLTPGEGEGAIELGATWINGRTQPKVAQTARRLGLTMVEQYAEGDELWEVAEGDVERAGPGGGSERGKRRAELIYEIAEAMDECSGAVDVRRPWRFPAGSDEYVDRWTARTIGDDEMYLKLLDLFAGALVGHSSRELGIHYFVDYIKSGGGWWSLVSEGEDGAQSLRIKEGTSAIATGLAASLPEGSVHLGAPVASITQGEQGCLVSTNEGESFRAYKVILAIPSNTYRHVEFTPPLPPSKHKLVTSTLPGLYAKVVLTYADPWWRKLGLAGKFSSFVGPICFTFDVSDDTKGCGRLACFITGDNVTEWSTLDGPQREAAVVNHLERLVGGEHVEKVRAFKEIRHVNWAEEEWIWGAPTCAMPPGLLSEHGLELRTPFQNIYFAGGETAYEWKGYLEGALRAGSRAAEEVITDLKDVGLKCLSSS